MIVCAAVIGQAVRLIVALPTGMQRRHHVCTPTHIFIHLQNNPLYLETMQQTGSEGSLRFHYIVHCSLDAVEEKREWPPLHALRAALKACCVHLLSVHGNSPCRLICRLM